MQQLLSVWLALDGRKRLVVMLSSVAMFAAVIGLARLATAPNMVTLYSGLDSSSAGEVVKALEQQGAIFEIKNNAIYVESGRRDELRLSLAAEGLPATNNQGYELLDAMTGFGTTAQMFDAAYWRAKEGELARTIVSSPRFQSARVHISNAPAHAFGRPQNASASIIVTARGNGITTAQARALRYLISSAVAGMDVSDVSVIDGRNGTVVQDDSQAENIADSTDIETRLKNNVVRILEARVGPGNAVVEVNVETSSESQAITERSFDPDSRVMISTRKEERTTSANGSNGGAVTVASNLPTGDANGTGSESSSQNSETSETTNYEVSETTREIMRAAGTVQKVSIAVLVDGINEIDPDTNVENWVPRQDSELEALRELVASAVGFDESRGDTLTIKSLQFQTPDVPDIGVESSLFQNIQFDVMRLIQLAVLALVSLILGLFVLRPALERNAVPALESASDPILRSADAIEPVLVPASAAGSSPTALTGEIDDAGSIQMNMPLVNKPPGEADSPLLARSTTTDNPVDRLREMISNREDETVEILRGWIDGTGEHS